MSAPTSPCCGARVVAEYDETHFWEVTGVRQDGTDEEHVGNTLGDFRRFKCDDCDGDLELDEGRRFVSAAPS